MPVPAEIRRRIAADFDRFRNGLPADPASHAQEAYGMDLTGEYAGRLIRLPFGKASGQLSMTVKQVEADAAAGLGFVVLKTVVAEDASGERSMGEWALSETAMRIEPIRSAGGRDGWTVTWRGRGWDRSFEAYLALYRAALAIGAKRGLVVAASVKYDLPVGDAPFRVGEYTHTTRALAAIGGPGTIIEKDFSPTLAGDERATAQATILRWLREVPGLIRAAAPVTVGLKLMNALFDDAFQVHMVRTAERSGAGFLVAFNRLFDPVRGFAYGGWDLSERNHRVLAACRPLRLPVSATGNIVSGRTLVEYARLGATSGQLHTFFQLPAEAYAARTGNRSANALHTLLYHPDDGLLAAMAELEAAGVLARRGGMLHFLDLARAAGHAA